MACLLPAQHSAVLARPQHGRARPLAQRPTTRHAASRGWLHATNVARRCDSVEPAAKRARHQAPLPGAQQQARSVSARASGQGSSSSPSGTQSTRPPSVAAASFEDAQQQQEAEWEEASSKATGWWATLPARYKVLVAASMSFVIGNMDKINMSVAIIPMAQDFGWSPSISGLVQSAFFWGYILSQLPGGYLTSNYGGRKVMPAGVGMWSAATMAVPLLASTIPGLCLSRAAVGLGEAVAPSAATDIVSRIVPPEERSRAVSFVFGGLHVGSIIGLSLAPWLIDNFGWEAVFVAFGAVGLVWVAWFESLMAGIAESEPEVAQLLTASRLSGGQLATPARLAEEAAAAARAGGDAHAAGPASGHIPWRAFLRSRAVQALMYTHFCNNWFHYTMLAWLPTYFTDMLSVDLTHAAQTALLPPLAGIAASAVAGPAADALITRGWKVSDVRKLAQNTAFLAPTALLLAAAVPGEDHYQTVALITAALGLSSFSLAGLYCTHQDLSPKYSSAMLGLTNTSGAIPGVVGVAITGFLYDQTNSWPVALFLPTAFFLLTGSLVYTFLGRNEEEDYDLPGLDAPFGIERAVKGRVGGAVERVKSALGLGKGKQQ